MLHVIAVLRSMRPAIAVLRPMRPATAVLRPMRPAIAVQRPMPHAVPQRRRFGLTFAVEMRALEMHAQGRRAL